MQPRDKFFTALLAVRSGSPPLSHAVEIIQAGSQLNDETVESLRSRLVASAQRGSWRYVLDLSRITTIDSNGLGLLVSALRSVQDAGGTIGLVASSPKLQRILELCVRSRSCKIYARSGDALRALRDARPKTAA
jgi:anti-sigma B factor antagonist